MKTFRFFKIKKYKPFKFKTDIYLSEVWKKEKKIIADFLMKNFNLEYEDENEIFFYKGNVKCVENF